MTKSKRISLKVNFLFLNYDSVSKVMTGVLFKRTIWIFLFSLYFLAGVLFSASVLATTETDLEQCKTAGYTELGGCKQNGRCEPTIYEAGKIPPSLECTGCPTYKLCCQKLKAGGTGPLASREPGCIEKIPDAETAPLEPIKFKPNVTIPGTIFTAGKEIEITGESFAQYVSGFYKFFIGFIAIAAVVMIMWGGFKRIMAAGSAEKMKDANETIFAALTGLVITLISYSLLNLVNPALVEFKSLAIDPVLKEEIETNQSGSDITSANFISNCNDPQPLPGTNGVPLYKQKCYANVPFGPNDQPCGGQLSTSSIASSGCGPSSLAMVLNFYGKSVTPIEIAKLWANSGFRTCNGASGSNSHGALTSDKVVGKYFLKGEKVLYWSKVLEILRNKKPVIVSVGPSIFTSRGHFIVLTGVDANGNISVNDPAKDCYEINGKKDCSRIVPESYIKPYAKASYYIHN